MEIERKFLVKSCPKNLGDYRKKRIVQGYISTSPTIRIRQSDDAYFITIKGSGTLSREELEIQITETEYASLLNKVESRLIEKDRYLIPIHDRLTAELDIYYNFLKGLLTVEVEFAAVEQAESFVPPDWFGADVTHDKRYSNSSLSIYGLEQIQN